MSRHSCDQGGHDRTAIDVSSTGHGARRRGHGGRVRCRRSGGRPPSDRVRHHARRRCVRCTAEDPARHHVDAGESRPDVALLSKWIPGEHMASGPIANLTGLHIFADGRELEWRRDLVETNAFAFAVPADAKTLTATYDYVVPFSGGAFGTLPSTNSKIAVINWYTVGLYPAGESPASITVTATLRAPAGWKHGGALDVASVDGDTVRYAPTSLEMLNDHPVLLGQHLRSITLWPASSPVGEHVIDAVADSEWALQFPPSRIEIYRRIVLEERAVFGGVGHYRKYHWLLTLSDNLGAFGVEHHECADDRVAENTFVDDDAASGAACCCHTSSSTPGTARPGARPGSSPAATSGR
ncbi:MAG: hypothetical protein ABIU38_28085 [Vicinamibacteraceae bacterium]